MDRFFAVESASAWVLVVATVLALGLAHLPVGDRFHHALHRMIRVGTHAWSLESFIGEGLMTGFFFLVGLELRRERLVGVLREARGAALPLFAALGGMLVPAIVYLAVARERWALPGWGIAAATDIAFAAAGLSLAGGRLPASSRPLLLSIAVLDDLGAIAVLALGYGAAFEAFPLVVACVCAGAMAMLRPRNRGTWVLFGGLAIGVWAGLSSAGIHAALSGVVFAAVWPTRTTEPDETARVLGRVIDHVHRPVAFGVMPIFAFAHAGVRFVGVGPSADAPMAARVATAVALALVLGKPLGMTLGARLATSLGLAVLPHGMRWLDVAVLGMLGGIGFTMSLLIAEKAFASESLLHGAKLGILLGSVLAATTAAVTARLFLPRLKTE